MIRIIDCRLIIEKYDTHEKYYPKVVSFDCIDEYPLSNVPQATITIISNNSLGSPESVSHVEFDDIVRLQISIRNHYNEKHVWIDLFEGRIQNQSKSLSRDTNIELSCVGHLYEAYYALLENDRTYTNQDARAIMQALATEGNKLGRITYSDAYAESGLNVPEYNVEAKRVHMSDVFADMEKISGYKRIIDVEPVYTAAGNLNTCYLRWFSFPTSPSNVYKIIEGTPRLISAIFDIVGEDVRTYRYVNGGTDESGNQYSGYATNAAAVAKYGNRYAVDTFTWVKSNAACVSIAAGLVEDSKLPYVVGQVELEGTPDAKKGDLVTVKINSIEIQDDAISGNYTVYRVHHTLSEKGFRTYLDLGRIKKSEYDYIAKNITTVVKTCYKNQVR